MCVHVMHKNIIFFFQLERTALHYAMGVPSVEVLSNTLIKTGAKRIVKDLVRHILYNLIRNMFLKQKANLFKFLEISTAFVLLYE